MANSFSLVESIDGRSWRDLVDRPVHLFVSARLLFIIYCLVLFCHILAVYMPSNRASIDSIGRLFRSVIHLAFRTFSWYPTYIFPFLISSHFPLFIVVAHLSVCSTGPGPCRLDSSGGEISDMDLGSVTGFIYTHTPVLEQPLTQASFVWIYMCHSEVKVKYPTFEWVVLI